MEVLIFGVYALFALNDEHIKKIKTAFNILKTLYDEFK